MHDLVKATKRQLLLTGTIAGGYASHFFYLLFRLDPRRMITEGFSYSSGGERKFVEEFGTLVTEYEVNKDGKYNSMSRGRMLGSPMCKPGISPLIFSKFLLDKAVFLNLTDMSKFLPPLNEYVEIIELEPEIRENYKQIRNNLKERMMEDHGKTLLGAFLQFSLSYSDKPYNRDAIISGITGEIIAMPADLSHLIKDGKLLNKEKRLIEIISQELKENRNTFIYCDYTGAGESNVTYRLKEIIQQKCNLLDHEVTIIESSYPSAELREEWMHQKAAEGTKVFITNPKCVKTGLDFCFSYNSVEYNYPTIIFYQIGYDMFTIWQASRRHYRLNQFEECKTYYLVSEGTIQPAAIELVASKQVATAAIQGQFSSEGLSAMAQGVDAKIKLAQAVSEMSQEQETGLKAMFDVLNESNNRGKNKNNKKTHMTMRNFTELTGISVEDINIENNIEGGFDILDILYMDEEVALVQENTIVIDEEPQENILVDEFKEFEREIVQESRIEEKEIINYHEDNIPIAPPALSEETFAAEEETDFLIDLILESDFQHEERTNIKVKNKKNKETGFMSLFSR